MPDQHAADPVEVSTHYLGEKGQAYFANQKRNVDTGAKLNALKFAPHVKPTDTVLDFGCGSGVILHHLPAAAKIGVEPNPAAREFCTNTMGIPAFASLAEVPDNSVDLAISHHCLEHVSHPVSALREIHRILKPAGRLLVFVPVDDWRTQRAYNPADINHHLHTWTPLSFGHTLFEAGFKNIHTSLYTHAFPPRYPTFHKLLPAPLFHALCYTTAFALKRRQIRASAQK